MKSNVSYLIETYPRAFSDKMKSDMGFKMIQAKGAINERVALS